MRVVSDADEFDEFEPLSGGEREIGGTEFEDDFVRGWVGFAHVGGVAEAERGVLRRWNKGFGKFC